MNTEKREQRLFIKNTGLREIEIWCMGSDTCPVLEVEKEMCPIALNHEKIVKHWMEDPVNGGRNSNGPKVAKFLVG